MSTPLSRRSMMQLAGWGGLAALQPSALSAAEVAWPPAQGSGTPKICVGAGRDTDEAGMRLWKQVGVDYVLMGGPKMPWQEAELRSIMDHFQAAGITVCNMMISGFNDVIYGRQGRDEQIEQVIQSIRAAGKAGLAVIEYNFYAHRLTEGYKEQPGRGGAGYTAYDYELSKNLPPQEGVGTHTRAEQLKSAAYFLKAVVPEARKSQRTSGAAPQRPARAAQPRQRADHGELRAVEDLPRPGKEPLQRNDVRLRRDPRDGRGPGQGVPLSRRARLHQPRPLPQRDRAQALRRLHRSLYRRRTGRYVRGDEGTRAPEISARASIRNTPGRSISTASAAFAISIPAAEESSRRSTTSPTPRRCCRPRYRPSRAARQGGTIQSLTASAAGKHPDLRSFRAPGPARESPSAELAPPGVSPAPSKSNR